MPYVLLNVRDDLSGIGLVPAPVKVLGDDPELDHEITRQVLGLDFTAFFPHSRTSAASSLPIITRASEPPIKSRRACRESVHIRGFKSSSIVQNDL
jgi:hypothetical protein